MSSMSTIDASQCWRIMPFSLLWIARDEHVGSWMHVVTMGHVSLRARMKG
jgi:hypothetical protein